MLGAILGDIAGSLHEGSSAPVPAGRPLFEEGSHPTDDAVMTIAVARAFMDCLDEGASLPGAIVSEMRRFGRLYPDAGYGERFARWLSEPTPRPYGSFGNGSAMRVSPVGWLFDDPDRAMRAAVLTAAPTHGHPEGLRGARAIAACVCLARTGASKGEVRAFVRASCGYPLDVPFADLSRAFPLDATCQGSVPAAIECFLASDSYEDAVRRALSLGGDVDTLASMAGAIAEAAWGIPEETVRAGEAFLDELLASEVRRWRSSLPRLRDLCSAMDLPAEDDAKAVIDGLSAASAEVRADAAIDGRADASLKGSVEEGLA